MLFNPFGRVTAQLPSRPTVTSGRSLVSIVTFTFAPARPVPRKTLSVEVTILLIVGVTVGAGGVTLTGTAMILDGCLLVASGASLPL